MSALWAWIVLAAVVATSVIAVEAGRRLLAGRARSAGRGGAGARLPATSTGRPPFACCQTARERRWT
ncbi:hypothetical protein, partial [Actinomadura sp. BRA 177]|uniref:hypothetical protein n=1 Tax=Actinomadura sp. BRA 177 TaxID=2745202 RepID=UPI001C3CB7E5